MLRVLDDWLLTAERAAIHLPTSTAVIADLHLGYAQTRRRGGEALPLPRADEGLAALRGAVANSGVRRLVIAGDLVEAGPWDAVLAELRGWLRATRIELAGIVPGNHDRGTVPDKHGIPVCRDGIDLGGWRVVHGDGALPTGRIVLGHYHPCLRWGRRITAPCYLVRADQLVLPAFSTDAAGVNVLGQPRWQSYRCCAIGGAKVLDFGEVKRLAASLRRARRTRSPQARG